MSTSPLSLDHVVIPRIVGDSVLDVGCGYGKWGFLAKKYFWNTENGDIMREPFVAGVDLYSPNLARLNKHSIYNLLTQSNAMRLPFKDNSFDTIIAMEIIEHMPEEDGFKLLSELERVARKRVMLSTPNKLDLRGGVEDESGFNPHEAHLSWWKIKTFKKLGYRCFGLGSKLWPSRLWNIVELSYVSFRLPWISDILFCVKDISSNSSQSKTSDLDASQLSNVS